MCIRGKKKDPMKKSENARRSWRSISASRSTNFKTFLSDQFFFIAIRLRICGGVSAPQIAANAVLMLAQLLLNLV
jgi:hypothetical protein